MLRCPNCQKIHESGKFCPECGTKLESVLRCSNCGSIIDPSNQFCVECGKPIIAKQPEPAIPPIPPVPSVVEEIAETEVTVLNGTAKVQAPPIPPVTAPAMGMNTPRSNQPEANNADPSAQENIAVKICRYTVTVLAVLSFILSAYLFIFLVFPVSEQYSFTEEYTLYEYDRNENRIRSRDGYRYTDYDSYTNKYIVGFSKNKYYDPIFHFRDSYELEFYRKTIKEIMLGVIPGFLLFAGLSVWLNVRAYKLKRKRVGNTVPPNGYPYRY